jgi:CheY-like chemotaxis protein
VDVAETILVIEDQEQNLYLMKYMLETHGYHVVLARDGREGLAAARVKSPDLILLDIQLPTMSGHDVARALQVDPVLSRIPVVAVTSYAMPGDRETVMEAGCTGYIEKPINPDTFIAEIRGYMDREQGKPENTQRVERGGAE